MIYRVEYNNLDLGSLGFECFSNKVDATKELKKFWNERVEKKMWKNFAEYLEFYMDSTNTPTSKKEIMNLLDRWATHPDNG